MVSTSSFLLLAVALFSIGAVGVVVRRNVLVSLMALGLMFNASVLVFAVFGRWHSGGEAIALLVLAASTAGLGVGIALGVFLFRRRRTFEVDELDQLRW